MAGLQPEEYLALLSGPRAVLMVANGSASVPVHTALICHHSPYCRRQIKSQSNSIVEMIKLPAATVEIARMLVQFFYTSRLVFPVGPKQISTIVELIELANTLECDMTVAEAASTHMTDILKTDRTVLTEILAERIFTTRGDNECKKLVAIEALRGYVISTKMPTGDPPFKYQTLYNENLDFRRLLHVRYLTLLSQGRVGSGGKTTYVDPVDGRLFQA